MKEAPESPVPRGKPIFVAVLILLPLVLIGVAKYSPWLLDRPKIASISIVPPRYVGPPESEILAEKFPVAFRNALGDLPGLSVLRPPSDAEVKEANDDMHKLGGMVGADALVLTSLTVDSGIIQLSIQVIDPKTSRVLYNNPYQSSNDRYPEMLQAAAAALKRTLEP